MTRLFVSFLFALVAGIPMAAAHGPTPQKIEEKITIAAPPDTVWNMVKDFGALAKWHPLVAEVKGTPSNAPGAEREVWLKQGGAISDSLDEYNAAEHSYSYRLSKENVDAFPVSFYSATLSVKPSADGKGSEVDWSGRFYRADTGNFPPEGKDDAAAVAAMTTFFKRGLLDLKSQIEAGKS
jgi:mxaD protein